MVSLVCTTAETDGVTLVTGRIENPDRPRRVRLENELDGPVWPPRRRGVPAAGWTDAGFECVLAADETRGVGYACPAPAEEPPLVVAEADPVDPDADASAFEPRGPVPSVEETPAGVVRALGSPRPPRDAVPVPDATAERDGPVAETMEATQDDPPETPPSAGSATPADRSPEQSTARSESETPPGTADGGGHSVETRVEAVEAWFAGVEARLDLAAELSGTTRLPVVADALDRAGGVAGVRDVDAQLDEDAEALRRVAERARTLADRAESATIPLAELDRLR
ncbi:hypothetical protein ACFR9U_04445 [Halorientalis brevis]|uniref:DUF8080 domain-containing protein n=1 Tax=Halorientalis brevis TaxID=1126241 RepID=A0ABD6C853_9EURY|nr:hypothetical protein [Halorientalis brevis]